MRIFYNRSKASLDWKVHVQDSLFILLLVYKYLDTGITILFGPSIKNYITNINLPRTNSKMAIGEHLKRFAAINGVKDAI